MSQKQETTPNKLTIRGLITLIVIVVVTLGIVLAIWTYKKPSISASNSSENHTEGHADEHGDHHDEHEEKLTELELNAETLTAANIEITEVTEQEMTTSLKVTATVEANEMQLQQASALVSGRIEKVNVVLGDYVKAGSVLAVIASPQIAQIHGKMHEAETKLALAQRNLQRIEKAENRVAVLTAKAKLNEAEKSLKRVQRLVELQASSEKDLIAAETTHQTAKAEYEFQSNIALNREIAEAKADIETAEVELSHIRDEMRAYGVPISDEEHVDHKTDTSLIPLRAPISGTIVERIINAGAGIETGKPLFTIADLSNVWVIANVPESQLSQIEIGSKAEIKAAILGEEKLTGKVTYIDPRLNEETRTAKVRIELSNPKNKLNPGMFVEANFLIATANASKTTAISSEAIQQIEQRTIVFIPKNDNPGHFEIREIELGSELSNGYRQVTSGLEKGEKLVSQGSFALKTQLLKSKLGEDHHH